MMIGTVNFHRLFTCKYKKSSNTYICLYCFDFLKGILLFLEGFKGQGIDFLKIKEINTFHELNLLVCTTNKLIINKF